MTSKIEKRYVLMTDHEGGFHDDYETRTDFSGIPELSSIVWTMSQEEVERYHQMFNRTPKYSNFRFVEVAPPTVVTLEMLAIDLEAYERQAQLEQQQRDAAAKKRKEQELAKKLAREKKKLECDKQLREAMYEQLRQEFANDSNK